MAIGKTSDNKYVSSTSFNHYTALSVARDHALMEFGRAIIGAYFYALPPTSVCIQFDIS